MSEPPLETSARLLVRPWRVPDAPALRAAIDEDVDHLKPWLTWTLEEPATFQETHDRLARWAREFEEGEGFRYAIVAREDPGRILGGVNLNCRVGPDAHDVGYWVRRSAARQGVASAAVARLVVHAFEERLVDRLVARCDIVNGASVSFAHSLGFRSAGEETIAYPDGSPRPVILLEMTRSDFEREHASRLWARGWEVVIAGAGGSFVSMRGCAEDVEGRE